MDLRVRSMLAWLIMAAMCGAIGFAIIFYYSTQARPEERFAIVIDAGSTQTRSNLFKISIDLDEMDESFALRDSDQLAPMPLSKLIKVQQVSSCVNGGPVAGLQGEHAARDLIRKCVNKFSNHIRLLDFVDQQAGGVSVDDPGELERRTGTEPSELMDADDVSKQMALINHRVNSVTHVHMGATAGMRALEQLNATRAHEKLEWMERAINESNSMIMSDNSPYLNRGYVGILSGSDEASFGWLSVNFVCDALNASAAIGTATQARVEPTHGSLENSPHMQNSNVGGHDELTINQQAFSYTHDQDIVSVGTLELGGASAQMAFQVGPNNQLDGAHTSNMTFDEQQLELFNGHYKLATRSDLCLGMSQAVLRLNYVLLHKTLSNLTDTDSFHNSKVEVINACMQRGALVKLTGAELAQLWHGACLEANHKLEPILVERNRMFLMLVISKHSIEFLGTGNVDQCEQMLSELIEPLACSRYFSLCPANKNKLPPLRDMPFVTISGYNHALNVLNLGKSSATQHMSSNIARLSSIIDDKLGGNNIDYNELLTKTREFCATEVTDIPKVYPKTNKHYQNIICLQLVYIRKLLTEFYQFDPLTSWSQIRFLIFSRKSVPEQYTRVGSSTHTKLSAIGADLRPDIGWTLGLLLNTTSQQMISGTGNEIHFHHGATVMYIARTVILIMLACCLIATALLVVGVIEVKMAQRRGVAYTSHGLSSSSSSSYDISSLGGHSKNLQPGADGALDGTSMLINFMSVHHVRDVGMSQ